ncbi:hypothetical protein [Frigidibacter oleivorans]|uniref:hypothetical protein n=1 Tax=Frigidibacter oleivorans TaxID=2487129 RepID=UPI000F8D06E9|nr:hypothetical protein [Frigidibacter oleivorans]
MPRRSLLAPAALSAALAAALALGAAAPALAQTEVREVAVEVDLSAIQNARAATVWANVGPDLQAALLARVADRVDNDGVRISIDINEIELSNSYEQALNIADSRLSGRVNISSNTDNTKFDTYDLSVAFDTAYLPAGADMTAIGIDSPAYYQAMIALFAERVVEKLN